MKMSDKELDKLFGSKLGDMEVEPSAAVWDNIKLAVDNTSGSNKGYRFYLQIAAAIIVLLGVAFMLRPQTEKIALHGNYSAARVGGNTMPPVIAPHADEVLVNNPAPQVARATNRVRKPHKNTRVMQRVDTAQVIADASVQAIQPHDLPQPELTGQQVTEPLTAPTLKLVDNGSVKSDLPLKIAAVGTNGVQKDTPVLKKKKIRSLGDLFNVVIAKVDKRPNKIIQFENNDDEDGDFGVSGINLGLIQVKKNN